MTENKDNQAPLQEQQDELKMELKKALNPNGENPNVNSYIDSTFSYISDSIRKMEETEDKDKTANEIAEDLGKKVENWLRQKQKEMEAAEETKKQE